EIARAQRRVLAQPVVRALWQGDAGLFGLGPRATGRSRDAALVLRRDWGVFTSADMRRVFRDRFASPVDNAAWHFGTVAGAAHFAYQAYLCSAEEAWKVAVDAARILQAAYSSWEGYVESYLEARGESDDSVIVKALLVDPRSSWQTIDWNTPIPDDLPIPLAAPRAVWSVASSEELHDALFRAYPGDLIRLAKGTYRGAFHPGDKGLTLVGEPGTILEADTDEPAFSTFQGVALEGLELRASGTVIVNCGVFLRLDRCRVVGGDDGLQSYSDEETGKHDFDVQLADCAFESTGDRAVVIEDGYALLQGTRIVGCGGHALTARARAVGFCASQVEIVSAGGAGARAFGADVKLLNTNIRDSGDIGLLLAKGSTGELSGTTISGSRGRGIVVKDGSELLADGCRFEDSAAANVDLSDPRRAFLAKCEILGGGWGGVHLHPAAGAIFSDCRVLGPKLACVFVEGAAESGAPIFTHSELGESREGGGVYVANGRLDLRSARIRDTPLVAVEVSGGSLDASDLRIADCAGGVIAHGGATLRLAGVEMTGLGHTGIDVRASRALVDGVMVRGGVRGIVAGHGSEVIATRCAFAELRGAGPDAEDAARAFALMVGEESRLTLLGVSIVGDGEDDVAQVITGGQLVAEGLSIVGAGACGIRVADGQLHLVGGDVRGSKSAGILLDRGAAASMLRTRLVDSGYSAVEVRARSVLLVRDVQLESAEGESAIFAHDGGRVVLQEGGVDGLAVEGDAVVQRQDDPDEGILADLLAAISGPKLAEAKAALAAWREGQLTRGAKGD
ncbi:MAG: right-handed parallel beta-helix repeat-containing protein, partial [Myxococcales bacterium]|nr:right-handed parallel beta-helix repeat-containing protein [Myxococcales bacterium]